MRLRSLPGASTPDFGRARGSRNETLRGPDAGVRGVNWLPGEWAKSARSTPSVLVSHPSEKRGFPGERWGETWAKVALLPSHRQARSRCLPGKSHTKPCNPRYFDNIECGMRVSDIFIDKTVFHALRGTQPLFHAAFGVNTWFGPAFYAPEPGLRG